MADPWDLRGALGASGFAGDLLWTAELAYAADALETTPRATDSDPPTLLNPAKAYPQLSGQSSLPVGDVGSLELNTRLGLRDGVSGGSSAQASTSLFYLYTESDYQLAVGPTFNHTELATVYGLRFGVTAFF